MTNCTSTGTGSIILVLFILLIIILGSYIQGGVLMACSNDTTNTSRGNGLFITIILYILLAIIFSSSLH